jgi:hypothetical protein
MNILVHQDAKLTRGSVRAALAWPWLPVALGPRS